MTEFRVFEVRRAPVTGERYGSYRDATPDDVNDAMVERAARSICNDGIRALDGTPATWERHADDFRSLARRALAAAFHRAQDQEGESKA